MIFTRKVANSHPVYQMQGQYDYQQSDGGSLILEQYLFMKIYLIQVIVAWAGVVVSCLHLQQQPRIYDPDQYASSLQSIQDQLRSQLNDIKQQFDQLDESIKNAAYDPNQELRLLQEGIADERDSLYQIQQYLTLPFNQRSCKCFNFTDDLRADLTKKLASVYQSLSQVANKAKECADCEIGIEIQTQIKYQQGYLQTMQDTVDSKCCKIYTILFKDNLNATSWMYGNFTPAQYQAWANDSIKNASDANTLTRLCPIYTPFVSSDFKTCTGACEDQTLVFNLQSRQCQICPVGKIFNYDKHRCEFNVVCPLGSQFNQDTVICEKIQPTYNDSLCPPSAPVWNPEALGCFKCASQAPFFDTRINKCAACPDNYVYSAHTNECVHKDCQTGQVYNQVTKQCENKKVTSEQTSGSQCPETKPFWDKNSLSCSRCPVSQPLYNSAVKKCQPCPDGLNYNAIKNVCTKQCSQGQQLNLATLQCQNVTRPEPIDNSGTQLSLCPPDRPIWNSQTKSCSQCGSENPYWNDVAGACQKCQVGQIWNQTLKSCQKEKKVECPPETVLNPSTGTCDKTGGSMAFCPPDRPFYNSAIMACSQCPKDKPNYDPTTNQCQSTVVPQPTNTTCPSGFTYDTQSKTCKPTSGNWTVAECPPSSPVWDENRGSCVPCPSGMQWNLTSKQCVNCADPSKCDPFVTAINTTCQFNYQWNSSLVKCVKCQAYQKFNTTTRVCDSFCKPGEVYDWNYDTCSGTISKCPLGLVFNQNRLRCECSEGASYRYVDENNACERFCKSSEYYDYLDKVCYPL